MSEEVKEKISNSVKNKTENERNLWIKRLSKSHLGQNPWNLGISHLKKHGIKYLKIERVYLLENPVEIIQVLSLELLIKRIK